jgi:hypothetical protein
MWPRAWVLPALLAFAPPAPALAQGPQAPAGARDDGPSLPRVLALAAVGAEIRGETNRHVITFPIFSETGQIDTAIDQRRARRFEIGAGVRVWKRFGAGASLALASNDGRLTSDIRLPHPFVFDQTHTTSASTTARQSTRDLHVEGLFLLHDSPGWQIVLSGGPTITWLRQELSSDRFEIRYFFPFEEILVLVRGEGLETSGRGAGGHAGVSVVRRIGRRAGLDGRLRWSRSPVALEDRDGHRVSIDTGGLSLSAGIRLAF